jgi:hypothetical protein
VPFLQGKNVIADVDDPHAECFRICGSVVVLAGADLGRVTKATATNRALLAGPGRRRWPPVERAT